MKPTVIDNGVQRSHFKTETKKQSKALTTLWLTLGRLGGMIQPRWRGRRG